MNLDQMVRQPVFFERNRVYRIYLGGMPYQEIFQDGYDDGTDNMFPEEWVASKVKAINPKYFGKPYGARIFSLTIFCGSTPTNCSAGASTTVS